MISNNHLTLTALNHAIAIVHLVRANKHASDMLSAVWALHAYEEAVSLMCK